MRCVTRSLLALVSLAVVGCGGGGGSGGSGGGLPAGTIFVDAAAGSDAAPGTAAAPMKSITAALAVAPAAGTVSVSPGLYDAANGELFPILLPDGVTLVGDVAAQGAGPTPTLIRGHGALGGNVAVGLVGAEGCVIAGLTIEDTQYTVGYRAILASNVGVHVAACTFTDKNYGAVELVGPGDSEVKDCDFKSNSYALEVYGCPGTVSVHGNDFSGMPFPVNIEGADSHPTIEANTFLNLFAFGINVYAGHPQITGNQFASPNGCQHAMVAASTATALPVLRDNEFFGGGPAIEVELGVPDLGTIGDLGGNDFSSLGAGAPTLTHEGAAVLNAIGNTWPHSPPTKGTDIVVATPGTVVWGTQPGEVF
jgi:hypothetical protein